MTTETPQQVTAITTMADLNIYADKLADLTRAINLLDADYNAKRADLVREVELLKSTSEASARKFVQEQIANQKSKYVDTPFGVRFGYRTSPGGIKKVDDEKLVAFFKETKPDIVTVKTTESVSAKDLKAYFETTHILPPGAELTAPTETFYQEVK